jgi:hypothetical protein
LGGSGRRENLRSLIMYFFTDKYGSCEMTQQEAAEWIKKGRKLNPNARFCDYSEDASIPTEWRGFGVL